MKTLLRLFLIACVVSVLLWLATSCASTRPAEPAEHGLPSVPVLPSSRPAPPDTAPKPAGLLAKVFGRKTVSDIPVGTMPRKCKNCTFVAAGATVSTVGKKATAATGSAATATVTGKRSGPTVVGDSSTANTLSGTGNLSTTSGNNNQTGQTTTAPQAEDWKAKLASPTGKALAALLVLGIITLSGYAYLSYRKGKAVKDLIS